MVSLDYSFYSKAELIEIIQEQNQELNNYEQINKTLNKENKVLYQELESLVPRVVSVEQFKEVIKRILASPIPCTDKVTNINNTLE